MSQVRRSSSMVLMFVLTLAALAVFAVPAFAQEDPNPAQDDRGYAQQDSRGYVADWSSHHNIFSNPGSEKKALDEGKYDHWLRVTNHQRFIMQENRRNRQYFRGGIGDNGNNGDNGDNADNGTGLVHKDWSMKDGALTVNSLTISVSGNNVVSTPTASTVKIGTAGTFTASPPTAGSTQGTFSNTPTTGTLTITNANTSNTLILSPNGSTLTTGTITLNSVPSLGSTITIGGVEMCFDNSTSDPLSLNCLGKGGNIINEPSVATTVNVAAILAVTINGDVPSVSAAAPPANVITVSNLTGAAVAWTVSSTVQITLSPTGSIAANPNTNVGCTSSTTGQFANPTGATTPNEAGALAAAVASCNTTYPAVGVTAAGASNVVTFTDGTKGNLASGITLTSTLTNFTFTGGVTTITIPNGSDGTDSATLFKYTTNGVADTSAQLMQDIATALNANTTVTADMSVSYTSGGTSATLTNKTTTTYAVSATTFTDFTGGSLTGNVGGTTIIPSTYPAKFGWSDTTAGTCYTGPTGFKTVGDYIVYPTGAVGSATNPNIVAYDNLYTGCPTTNGVTTTPGILFAYDTPVATNPLFTTQGTTGLSPTISFVGDQIAYIENSTTPQGYLMLLKWAAGLTSSASFTCTAKNGSPTLAGCTTTVPSAQIVGATFPTTTDIASGAYVIGFNATAKSITMSANATGGADTATITIKSNPADGDTVTIGTKVFCFHTAAACTGDVLVTRSTTSTTTNATNLKNAINTAAIANVTATSNTNVVTVTNAGATAISLATSDPTDITLSGSSIPAGASVTFTLPPPTMSVPYILAPQASAAAFALCTAPCYYPYEFGNGATDTYSSPFATYNSTVSNAIFVGDDSGKMHKFTGVLNSQTPAESGNPFDSVSTGKLNSPVYDGGTSQLVYVTDTKGVLYSMSGATAGAASASSTLDCGTAGFADAPYVDSSAEEVYVFNGGCSGTPSSIIQFPAGAITGSGTAASFANTPDAGTVQYEGAFDNTYYTSGPAAGNLYGCVNGVMYQVPMSSFGSGVNAFATLGTSTSDAATCSPVAEYYNSSTSADYLFVSLAANGTGSGCGSGCLYGFSNGNSTPTGSIVSNGGTSGIVMDNSGTGTGQSNIYYNSLNSLTSCSGNGVAGTGGAGTCAVQVTQTAP